MPLYEYRCRDCGKVFELLRRISEADQNLECPSCTPPRLRGNSRRLLPADAAHQVLADLPERDNQRPVGLDFPT